MGSLNGVKKTGNWLVFYLSIVSGSILAAIVIGWLSYDLVSRQLHLAAQIQMSQVTLMHEFNRLMRYLVLPGGQSLVLPHFKMSANGLAHFKEVKHLFLLTAVIFLVTIVPALRGWRRDFKSGRQWRYIRPMQVALVMPIVIGLIASVSFDRFFVLFHELLFRNLDWQFDPLLDPIILVLPEQYFMLCFICFFVILEGLFLIILWRAKKSLKIY